MKTALPIDRLADAVVHLKPSKSKSTCVFGRNENLHKIHNSRAALRVKMITHVYLVPTLRMGGAIPLLFYAVWYGAYSSTRITAPYDQKVM
jgi:hypothetical protein